MPYRFSPFTGTLDYYQSGSSSGVTGVAPTTPGAIAAWVDTGATVIQNTNTLVQAGGAIQAQGFLSDRQINGTVNVPTNYTWITDSLEMQPGSIVTMNPGSKIIMAQ